MPSRSRWTTSSAADALFAEAVVRQRAGDLAGAAERYRQLLSAGDHPPAALNLGHILRQQGDRAGAIDAYRRAAVAEWPASLVRAADALRTIGALDEALVVARHAVASAPDDAAAHNVLGAVAWDAGDPGTAEASFLRAVALAPTEARHRANLAAAQRGRQDVAGAIRTYRAALAQDPDDPDALNGLAGLLQLHGETASAIEHYRRALARRPDDPHVTNNLATALLEIGAQAESEALSERASFLAPDHPGFVSNRLYGLNYLGRRAPGELALTHRAAVAAWERAGAPNGNERDPERRLRVGYVSADLRDHPVARFLLPLLRHHDPAAVEVFAYANGRHDDGITRTIRAAVGHWREIWPFDDARVEAMMRADGIDVLVDLSGHTAANRLPLFARRPAPVQATWLGYPATTGLATFDARIVDAVTDPPGSEDHASEPLARLDGGFLAFDPLVAAADPGPPPSASAGHVTFGAFSNLAKVTDAVIDAWCAILAAVDGAHLFLKARALRDERIAEWVQQRFAGRGVDPARLRLSGFAPGPNDLAGYRSVDVALDPFPYNGTTTTCEALWMGVPMVTLRGDRHAARVGASLLARVGLDDLVADTPERYVAIATAIAGDVDRRALLRTTLRERLRASPLGDGARLAREIEALYRRLWRAWCAR